RPPAPCRCSMPPRFRCRTCCRRVPLREDRPHDVLTPARNSMRTEPAPPGPGFNLTGRCFVHPVFDYLLIGGGLSLLVTLLVVFAPTHGDLLATGAMAGIVLFSNGAHFAASTVRLYTKPGAARSMPFLSKAVPPIAILLMTLCLVYAGR